MDKNRKAIYISVIIVAFFILWCPVMLPAEDLYVDAERGRDSYPGTLAKPLKTIQRAAEVMALEMSAT